MSPFPSAHLPMSHTLPLTCSPVEWGSAVSILTPSPAQAALTAPTSLPCMHPVPVPAGKSSWKRPGSRIYLKRTLFAPCRSQTPWAQRPCHESQGAAHWQCIHHTPESSQVHHGGVDCGRAEHVFLLRTPGVPLSTVPDPFSLEKSGNNTASALPDPRGKAFPLLFLASPNT